MFNSIIKRLPVIAFLCLVCVPVLVGQTSGSVSGHVDDATKASIPAALVTLKNVATGTERTTVTTGAGDYTFTEVPVGVYTVSATHAGFKTSSSDNVEVQVQQSIRLDFSLQVGAVTQSIEVQATGALLQADNSALGTVIDNAAVNELPLNGRNYLGLVALSSNVNTLSSASGQAGSRAGRRSCSPVDRGRGPAHHVRLLHAGWREQYGSRLQHLCRAALPGRHPGVQGPDRCLFG